MFIKERKRKENKRRKKRKKEKKKEERKNQSKWRRARGNGKEKQGFLEQTMFEPCTELW